MSTVEFDPTLPNFDRDVVVVILVCGLDDGIGFLDDLNKITFNLLGGVVRKPLADAEQRREGGRDIEAEDAGGAVGCSCLFDFLDRKVQATRTGVSWF